MATKDGELRAESKAALIISLAVIFFLLSATSVALRAYTRTRILKILGADDITIIIAQGLAVAVSVTTILEVVWGLGRHTQFVSREDAVRQLQCLYANIMIYNASQIFTKISFLIQYRRLFPSERIQRICSWLLVFIAGWGVAQEFIVGFSCVPLTSFLPKMAGKCIYTLPVWYLTSCMNIVTDFMILVIPIVPVIRLRIRRHQKYLLLCLFCLGFFTCIISLVRLSTLHKGIHTKDPFWDNAPAAYWSVVELNCGILCACFPTLRPLLQKVVPRLQSARRGSSEPVSSNEMNSLRQEKSRDVESGVYVQRDIEFHSTTELREATIDICSTGDTAPPGHDLTSKAWSGNALDSGHK